ncbi:MAG: VWA domain-containing protein [Vicinamibacterales bacterium]
MSRHAGLGAPWLAAALVVGSLGVAVTAQSGSGQSPATQPPATPPAGQPANQTQGQKPSFSVEINLVTTDVIARDGSNVFISDLKRDDFEIYEDGIKQDVASLVLIHGGRSFNLQSAPPPPAQEGIILPPQRPTNDAAGRIFLLFVDDLHLDFRNTGRIRDLFKKISTNLIHEGDMFGIVSTGPSSIAIDLTYDRKRLDEAIKKITGNGLKPSDIIQGPEGADGPSEVRYRAHVAFSTVGDIVKELEKVQNRRKAVIYVSNGYDFNPFPEGRLGEDPVFGGRFGEDREENRNDPTMQQSRQGQQFADADLVRELAELTRTANRANATLYTIDPRGLVGGPDLDEQLDPVEWNNYVRKSQDSLRVLADETGGIAVVNQNDFDKALKRIDAETSDYYVLGYYSSNPDPTIRTRKLEVKVKRPDIQVWSRKAYSLKAKPTSSAEKR